ncbi:MAG: HIT family protein [Flavobacteriales bacterium]|nr:HIT family protein [Flavobacteriales bacterium]|tara:strand:+ start:2941 stop:3333 length:393 start_codon:yes stop_codon:yes gene_type:complete
MASIFTKIVQGEIPCYKVAETEDCIAFLDILPLVKGHVLVVPKREVDYYFDLDDELFEKVNHLAKKVARAIKKVVPCERIGVSVIGLEVPHAHVHLVPINSISDLDFTKQRVQFSEEEFKELAEKIAANL